MLYYEEHKSLKTDKWIVLIHGMGGSIRTWGKQIDYYKTAFNVLAIDLHGHGKSKCDVVPQKRFMSEICDGILEVLDHLEIRSAHFAALSLGTMINLAFAAKHPKRVDSLVMGGCVMEFNKRTNFLLTMAQKLKGILPYMWLYQFFALIVLPKSNHAKSRGIFAREASKIGHAEFCAWLNFLDDCRDLQPYIDSVNSAKNNIPILIVMGDEDHLFMPGAIKGVEMMKNTNIHIIKECGHICNIQKWAEFNKVSFEFITAAANAKAAVA